MPDRILALHRMDLVNAAQLASQLGAQGGVAPLITVFDPTLLTHAQNLGLEGVRLLAIPDCDIAHGAYGRALAATRLLCARAETALTDLVPEARGAQWCAHLMQYLHMTAFGYRDIALAMAGTLSADRVHVLLPDLPYRFGSHSFVPGLLVSDTLRQAGVAVQLYRAPLPAWEPLQLPDLASAPAVTEVDLLCHLPTCAYDEALFGAEILASGRTALVLPSQHFDAPLAGLPRCALATPDTVADRLPASQRARVDAMVTALAGVLAEPMNRLLPATGLAQQQLQVLLEGCRIQALLFLALEQRFAARPPQRLLISNHDGGLHGALYSFAQRHGVRVLVLPHSKIFNMPHNLPLVGRGLDLLCLTHALQGGDVVDIDGNQHRSATLDFAKPWQVDVLPPQPLATVGIVLNSVAINCMCNTDLGEYLQGLARLRDWCLAHQVRCRIRCRPNGSVHAMLGDAIGVSAADLERDQQGGIADFGRGCDLVLGYDIPTSGMFDLLNAGVPALQALCRPLAPNEWRIVDPTVVPQLPVAAMLERLDGFASDSLALWRFRRDQTGLALQAGSAALPLRAWL